MTHWYLTIKYQQQTLAQRVQVTPEQNPGTPPRGTKIVVHLVTQEEIKHTAPNVLIAMHDMAKQMNMNHNHGT